MKKVFWCALLTVIFVFASATIGWAEEKEKGPLSIKIGQGGLTFWGYFHIWYAYFQDDDTVESGGFVYPANEPGGFDIRRARLLFDGSINPKITFRVHFEAAGKDSNKLKDAFVKFQMHSTEKSRMHLTLGQWKIPFTEAGQKWLTPADEFIRGPMILEQVGGDAQLIDRDLGAMFDSKLWDDKFYCAIGIFDGAGYNQRDENDKRDIFAHVTVSPLAKNSPAGTLEFGLSGMSGTEGPEGKMYDRALYAGRIKYLKAFKSGNVLMLRTEYISKKVDDRDTLTVFGVEKAEITDWYFAAAYKFMEKYEIIGRCDLYDNADMDTTYGERAGYTIGFNWYASKNIRLMSNISMYDEDIHSFDNNEAIVQLEFRF